MKDTDQREPDEDDDQMPETVICVACHKPGDPDQMNCPDAGWMHERCYDERYGG